MSPARHNARGVNWVQCLQRRRACVGVGDNPRLMTETNTSTDFPADVPKKFETLALDAKLLRAVAESGYTSMTPIQAKAIPIVDRKSVV